MKWKKIEKKDIKWFLIWILPASFQPIITFISFNHLPLGTTFFTLLHNDYWRNNFWKNIFSEKFNWEKLFSLILVLTGLYLIYRSDITLVKNGYVFLAMASGLIVGFWNTLTKKVSGSYPELQMMFLDGLSTLLVGFLGFIVVKERLPTFIDITP